MRTFIIAFCIIALVAIVTSSPPLLRKVRQAPETPDRWWWNRPTRPTPTPTPTARTTPPGPPSQVAFDRCMRNCLRTPEYNPLCVTLNDGTRKTYNNEGEMMCAAACGEASTLLFRGSCVAIN